ncbi:hypothetical protein TNIN_270401 [Trichonephila inaurata madagascariensis]|uniref:Uncharacterized protein n=1 Tax=Trichonephila inaurata madagascariensis TaxID=2747483 RepID=A0A8X6Y8X8_9ARAC|nr:hypothetical protein TNIN_270401 [Trichonephila inaurata madagascariensis]
MKPSSPLSLPFKSQNLVSSGYSLKNLNLVGELTWGLWIPHNQGYSEAKEERSPYRFFAFVGPNSAVSRTCPLDQSHHPGGYGAAASIAATRLHEE